VSGDVYCKCHENDYDNRVDIFCARRDDEVRVQLDCTNGYNLRYALNQVLYDLDLPSPPTDAVFSPWVPPRTHGEALGTRDDPMGIPWDT
jgi:hypothetical protein